MSDVVTETMGALVWNADASAFLYGQVNDQWRIDMIKLHRIGAPTADDVVIYHEYDIGFQCGAGMTHDRKWIAVAARSEERRVGKEC